MPFMIIRIRRECTPMHYDVCDVFVTCDVGVVVTVACVAFIFDVATTGVDIVVTVVHLAK